MTLARALLGFPLPSVVTTASANDTPLQRIAVDSDSEVPRKASNRSCSTVICCTYWVDRSWMADSRMEWRLRAGPAVTLASNQPGSDETNKSPYEAPSRASHRHSLLLTRRSPNRTLAGRTHITTNPQHPFRLHHLLPASSLV